MNTELNSNKSTLSIYLLSVLYNSYEKMLRNHEDVFTLQVYKLETIEQIVLNNKYISEPTFHLTLEKFCEGFNLDTDLLTTQSYSCQSMTFLIYRKTELQPIVYLEEDSIETRVAKMIAYEKNTKNNFTLEFKRNGEYAYVGNKRSIIQDMVFWCEKFIKNKFLHLDVERLDDSVKLHFNIAVEKPEDFPELCSKEFSEEYQTLEKNIFRFGNNRADSNIERKECSSFYQSETEVLEAKEEDRGFILEVLELLFDSVQNINNKPSEYLISTENGTTTLTMSINENRIDVSRPGDASLFVNIFEVFACLSSCFKETKHIGADNLLIKLFWNKD